MWLYKCTAYHAIWTGWSSNGFPRTSPCRPCAFPSPFHSRVALRCSTTTLSFFVTGFLLLRTARPAKHASQVHLPCTHIYTYIHAYTLARARTHTHAHTHTHTRTHAHTHTPWPCLSPCLHLRQPLLSCRVLLLSCARLSWLSTCFASYLQEVGPTLFRAQRPFPSVLALPIPDDAALM
jgi:hypothetical protein